MSSFGTLFKVSTFGESHCHGVGCIVEGVPPRMHLGQGDIQTQMDRRRPGQSKITTQRNEKDQAIIMSGIEVRGKRANSKKLKGEVEMGRSLYSLCCSLLLLLRSNRATAQNGITLGTPIAILVRNEDQRPHDYSGAMVDIPRPSHADYTYQAKYGVRASSGGGRASARETVGRVAAGAIAEKWLRERYGVEIVAWVSQVGDLTASREWEDRPLTREDVDANIVRCPDATMAKQMQSAIESALADADSLGGVVTCIVRNVPAGLGEPVFDKLEALLAHAMLSIPSTKGFEIGSGFEGTRMRGSKHNDLFVKPGGAAAGSPSPSPSPPPTNPALNASAAASVAASSSSSPAASPSGKLSNSHALSLRTLTNRSGGIQGGISNGEPLVMRVAFKPPATIGVSQATADFEGSDAELKSAGRHDPCVLPRAIPIVEAMAALVLADCALMQLAREAASAGVYPVMGKVPPPPKPEGAQATTTWNASSAAAAAVPHS